MSYLGNFGGATAELHDGLLAIGQPLSNVGGRERGAVWFVELAENSSILSYTSVNDADGLQLSNYANFGAALARVAGRQGRMRCDRDRET